MKTSDAFSPGEFLSSPPWLRFSKKESKACRKSIFIRDVQLTLVGSLCPSPCLLFGHRLSQAREVMR